MKRVRIYTHLINEVPLITNYYEYYEASTGIIRDIDGVIDTKINKQRIYVKEAVVNNEKIFYCVDRTLELLYKLEWEAKERKLDKDFKYDFSLLERELNNYSTFWKRLKNLFRKPIRTKIV